MTYHYLLSKNAIDTALSKWKHGEWPNRLVSAEVYRTLAAQSFPAPDSMLFDPTHDRAIAFEFKPPTENKRGILTGFGQAVAYLSASASLAYLVAPSILDGFDLRSYLISLFNTTVKGKLPVGLITYSDESAKQLDLAIDIEEDVEIGETRNKTKIGRYWAKHQDMPLHLAWILLDIAYSLPEGGNRLESIWRYCWDNYLFPESHRTSLEVIPTAIKKHDGIPLFILDKNKRAWAAKISRGELILQDALEEMRVKTDPECTGDNLYNSYKKNLITFIKHLQLWDDAGHLTEDGLFLHRIGKIHGPTGETFRNYFARILLFNGKHMELILDVEKLTRNKRFLSVDAAIASIKESYLEQGLFKLNPGRVTTGAHETFLKYERIIWGHLGFLKKERGTQFIPNHGFLFDWDMITKLCSLEN